MFAACSFSEVLSVKLMECLVVQKKLGTTYDLSSLLCGICFGEDKLEGKGSVSSVGFIRHPKLELPSVSFLLRVYNHIHGKDMKGQMLLHIYFVFV